MNNANAEDARVILLCQSAFHAEHRGQFQEAYNLHRDGLAGLTKLVNDAGFFDRERKRVARKQIKFHSMRMQMIKPILDGKQDRLAVVLPTSVSLQEELQVMGPNGGLQIGLEELLHSKYVSEKATNPATVVNPVVQHLLQSPVPFFTPTLNPSLPTVTYHIYYNLEDMFMAGRLYYFKVKTATDDRQTLYVLQVRKKPRYQMNVATLHRATEFTSPCVVVQIAGVQATTDSFESARIGRPMEFITASSRTIREEPDRFRKTQWGPRRFTYAGRHFVWMTENGRDNQPQSLYEVEKFWPQPGSKTGKKQHKVVGGKICWGEEKLALKKVAIIHMVGGLDQLFREYLLASQLTRLAVIRHGHD